MSKSKRNQPSMLTHYKTYILRFWQEQNTGSESATWRFALIDTTTNSEYGFPNFDELVAFLKNQINTRKST